MLHEGKNMDNYKVPTKLRKVAKFNERSKLVEIIFLIFDASKEEKNSTEEK